MLILTRLIKRAAVIGRLFYHTTLCILAETAPEETPRSTGEWRDCQLHHARQLCGIVSHSTDRGIASTAARCLVIVAKFLTERKEREEVLQLLNTMSSQSGLRMCSAKVALEMAWQSENRIPNSTSPPGFSRAYPLPAPTNIPIKPDCKNNHGLILFPQRHQKQNVVNPLRCADFNLPNHPYQNWYEPPNKASMLSSPLF